jgi:hypothetical protein
MEFELKSVHLQSKLDNTTIDFKTSIRDWGETYTYFQYEKGIYLYDENYSLC